MHQQSPKISLVKVMIHRARILCATILIIVTTSTNLLSQIPHTLWVGSVGGTLSTAIGMNIVSDALGNMYIRGSFKGTIDFDPSPTSVYNLTGGASAITNMFIAKYDANGNFIWAKGFNTLGNIAGFSIAIDAQANIYATGGFYGTTDFNPSLTDSFNLYNSSTQMDMFILKIDSAGNFDWVKQITGPNQELGNDIVVDNKSNVYVTGNYQGTPDFDPSPTAVYNLQASTYSSTYEAFVSKYDSSGNFVWAKAFFSGSFSSGNSLALDSMNNIITNGQFQGYTDFDPTYNYYGVLSYNSGAAIDMYVTKLDTNGNFVWEKSITGPGYKLPNVSLKIDASGNIFSAGLYSGTNDFDPSPTATSNLTSLNNSYDVFVCKLNASGIFQWAKSMGGNNYEQCMSFCIDSSGNSYVTGGFSGTADFDPSPTATYNLVSTGTGGNNTYIAKLDASGNFVWADDFPSTSNSTGYGLLPKSNGHTYCSGSYTGTANFNPNGAPYYQTAPGGNTMYLANIILVAPNSQPIFTGAKHLSVCQNAASTPFDSLLKISDNDTGQVETFTLTSSPAHGAVVTGTTVASGINVSPTGWSYSPNSGYSGNDQMIITVNDGNGGVVHDTISVTVIANTSSTTNVSVCSNTLPYIWNGNSYNSNGSYTVHLSNSLGCDSAATLNLTINAYTFSTTTITACDNYSWSVNNQTYTTSGIYTHVVGCHTDSLLLTIHPLPTVSAGNNFAVCEGASVTLSGNGATTYSWNNGVTNGVSFIPTQTKTYTVIGTSAFNCSSSAQVTITVNPLPIINAGADKLICPGGISGNTSVTLTATGGVSYSWSGGITNGVAFSPIVSATYVVVGTDSNGCDNKDSVMVNIRDLTVHASGPRICKGLSVTLTAPSGSNYVWKKNGGAMNGKTSQSYVAFVAGNYSVTYVDSICGLKTLPTVPLVIQNRPPAQTITATLTSFCPGLSSTLSVGDTYPVNLWFLGSTLLSGVNSKSYTTAVSGSYKMKVVDSFGCISNYSNGVFIRQLTVPATGIAITKATKGAKKLTSAKAFGYQWRYNGNNIVGATNRIYIATQSGIYGVTVTNSSGCSAVAADTTLFIVYTGPKMNQDELLALTEQEENEAIVVYPNPSNRIFTIATENSIKATVTDLQGRVLMELNDATTINLSQYANGIYLLQLLDDENRVIKTVKLVKE